MCSKRLYIVFLTLFLVFCNIAFCFANFSSISDVTFDHFISQNRRALDYKDSFPDQFSSFEHYNYCYHITVKSKRFDNEVKQKYIYSTVPLFLKFDAGRGYYYIVSNSPGFAYVSDPSNVGGSPINLISTSPVPYFVISFDSTSYDLTHNGSVRADYINSKVELGSGENLTPGDQEKPPGVIGSLESLSLSINLVIKYLVYCLILILCYLILPTLLKKLLNFFLQF